MLYVKLKKKLVKKIFLVKKNDFVFFAKKK